MLDSLGVTARSRRVDQTTAVTSRTPDGLVVITRPGSHGASASSLRDALAPFVHRPTQPTSADSTAHPTKEPR